jgi:hypothetical protein
MRREGRRETLEAVNENLDQGGKVMVGYFCTWGAPLVIAGTVVLLALPWLGLIALFVFALAVLAALTGAIVAAPYLLGRSVYRHFHDPRAASARNRMHAGRLEEAGIR